MSVFLKLPEQDTRPAARTAWQSSRWYVERLRSAGARHSALIGNAAAITGATLANGLLGFAFWWVAARAFAPAAVGLAGSAISLMSLISVAGDFGITTLLATEAPRNPRQAPHLIAAAILFATAASGLLGLVLLALMWAVSGTGAVGALSLSASMLLVAGAAIQTACVVLDASLVALLLGVLRLYRNLIFSVSKLVLLVAAVVWPVEAATPQAAILFTWAAGLIVSFIGVGLIAKSVGLEPAFSPRFSLLQPLLKMAMWHHIVNVAAAAPALILPSLITLLLAPELSAPFFAAWMILSMAIIVPAALTTVLLSTVTREPSEMVPQMRLSLAISIATGIATFAGFFLLSTYILAFINPAYPDLVGNDLRLLGLAVLFIGIKMHFVAIARLEKRLARAAAVIIVAAVIELAFATIGAKLGGLGGLIHGWLLALALIAAALFPVIATRLKGSREPVEVNSDAAACPAACPSVHAALSVEGQ